ncbi:hypothetical protein YC2023_081854 [Brassica napus]
MSLILADEGNTVLAREATYIAIWSLAKNFFCWARWRYLCREHPDASLVILETLVHDFKRRWYYLYEKNLKASVFLLETLLQDGKYDFQKLSLRAILTISQTMKSFLIKVMPLT